MRPSTALALLLLAIPSAADAVSIKVKNCADTTIDAILRDGASPSGPVTQQQFAIAHDGEWTGSCNTEICWLNVRLSSGPSSYQQVAADVCVLALTASNTSVINPIYHCRC